MSNAIRVRAADRQEPVEISELLPRMKPLTEKPLDRFRHYIPRDLRMDAEKLKKEFSA